MNILSTRISSILGLLILLAGFMGGTVLMRRQQVRPRAATGGKPIDLAISNVSDQSFSVSWTTTEQTTGRILMGTRQINDIRDSQTEMLKSTTHFVTVDGLETDKEYKFRVESGGAEYDNQGKAFAVTTTASLAGSLPVSDMAQGVVRMATGAGAAGAIVYAQLPGGQLLATLTADSGNWVLPLSTSRTGDLSRWLAYDRTAAVYTIQADGGSEGKTAATVTTGIDQPASPLILGQNYDFRQGRQQSDQITDNGQQITGEPAAMAESNLRSLFNFEDLGTVMPANSGVTLLNPGEEEEKISTVKPEFFGGGPAGTEVNITIESPKVISGNAIVEDDGKWKFAMPTDLTEGKHTITLTWIDAKGILQIFKRSFMVQASVEPAFTASPSATPIIELRLTPETTRILSPTPTIFIREIVVPEPPVNTPKSGKLTQSIILFMIGTTLILSGGYLVMNPNKYD